MMWQAAADQLSKLKIEMSELEKQEADYKKKEEELIKKEKVCARMYYQYRKCVP